MNYRSLYDKNDLGKSFGLAVAMMLVAQFALSFIFYGIFGYIPEGETEPVLSDTAFWIMQLCYTLLIGSTAFIYAAITKTEVLEAAALKKAPSLAQAGWGVLAVTFLIMLMLPINDFLMQLIVKAGLPQPSVDLPMQVVPMILIACILPAFTEEVVFRGTVARSLERCKNKLAALAVSGGLFALFHLNPAQTVHQFVLGAFLTMLVLRSGSLYTSSIVHLFNNLAAVVLGFVISDETVFTRLWYVFIPIGLLGFAASVYGMLKTTKSCWRSYGEEEAAPKTDVASTVILIVAIAVCVVLWVINLLG